MATIGLSACTSGGGSPAVSNTSKSAAQGTQSAAQSHVRGLKITHYPGGLDVECGVSGESGGTIAGHQVLVSGGDRYSGFQFDPKSCRVSGGHVLASGKLTNTLGQIADFSFTADVLNEQADGTMVSQTPVGTAAFQVYKLPPGQQITADAIGNITGEASGSAYGCFFTS